jgi:hypothetical protein
VLISISKASGLDAVDTPAADYSSFGCEVLVTPLLVLLLLMQLAIISGNGG